MHKNIGLLLVTILLLSGCLHGPSRHQFGSYSDAEKFYAEGKYRKAIGSYEKYMDESPDGNLAIIAQYYVGKSHAALGEEAEAKAAFEKIVNQYPDVIWAELSKEQLKNIGVPKS